jgi:hypothetical protein
MRLQTEFHIVVLTTAAVGVGALSLILWAFSLIARNGGWVQAMKRTEDGRWPAARWLLLVGALLGVVSAPIMTWLAGLKFAWPH